MWITVVAGGMKWSIIGLKWEEVGRTILALVFRIFIQITMLIGEYIHTLDDKNRLSLPVKFRSEMGKKLVLSPGLDGAIFMFTEKEWAKIAQRLSSSSMLAADNRSFNRFMFGGAVETAVDGSGRILIPDFLKDRAELKGKVAVVGVQNRVELWNEAKWNAYKKGVDAQANELAGRLGSLGVL